MASGSATDRRYRIGEVAALVETTPRTIRYYEEIGLLPEPTGYEKGRHRTYGEPEIARLRELIRLRDLLGITLEGLKGVVEAEEARAVLRERFAQSQDEGEQIQILNQALVHLNAQLELVRGRKAALEGLERELGDRRRRIRARLRELAG